MADPLGALLLQGAASGAGILQREDDDTPPASPTPRTSGSAAATCQQQPGGAVGPAAAALPPPEPPALPRAEQFRRELAAEVIDLKRLKELAFGGVPDNDRGLRSVVWRLLLGLLPPERAQWERTLRRKRAEYAQFCEELIVDPKNLGYKASGIETTPGSHPNPLLSHDGNGSNHGSSSSGSGSGISRGGSAGGEGRAGLDRAAVEAAEAELQRLALGQDDHPLSTSSSSKWKAYFQDVEVQEQIERDVTRTHPDMHFFSGPTGPPATHRQQMRRALFVFAKLNPGLRYVQGMNELYAPLYYLFRTDPDPEAVQHAEADAFFCFVDLMGEFRDHFCQQLDNSTVGIRATLGRLSALVRAHDEELWEHLEREVRINPQFYAFRWITLALTQEFPFPDAMRLWDSLLSDPAGRTNCLLRLCTAMLLHVRRELMAGDFASNMKLLQSYPPADVAAILQRAEQLKHAKSVIVLD